MKPVIVIGASPSERIPAIVCEYTIKKFCPEAEVIQVFDRPDRPTRGLHEEGGKDPTNFSFVRFWLPEICERNGRAIYLDSDMILFANIQELYDLPMGDRWVLRHSNPSVLLVDCERTPWDVRSMIRDVDEKKCYGANLMTLGFIPPDRVGKLSPEWNCLDSFNPATTKLLHFTDMNRQPWPNHRHPDSVPQHALGWMWYRALAETLETGILGIDDLHPSMWPHVEKASESGQKARHGL